MRSGDGESFKKREVKSQGKAKQFTPTATEKSEICSN